MLTLGHILPDLGIIVQKSQPQDRTLKDFDEILTPRTIIKPPPSIRHGTIPT